MSQLYTSEELIENFTALMDSYDFTGELAILSVGRLQVFRRRQAMRELRTLFIALWKLALSRSVPDDTAIVFDAFLSTYINRVEGSEKERGIFRQKVDVYNTLLREKGAADFSGVASFMTELIVKRSAEKQRAQLKLALSIRSMYQLIFDRLL